MLSADSSALKSESDDQRSPTPPTIPSVVAFSCTLRTRWTMLTSDAPGNAFPSSLTKKSPASARCAKPKSASARKMSGTKESSAKYATIAARCVPRSAKNFFGSWLNPTRTQGVCTAPPLLTPASVAFVDAAQALADLLVASPHIDAATVFGRDDELLGSAGVRSEEH